MPAAATAILRAALLALLAFAIFGPLLNLMLWAFAERWYFPSKLPLEYGLTYWYRVFQPRGNALASLGTSVWIALLTVVFSLAVAVPAGYALARLKLPWRGAILLLFLLPQAVPNLPVYVNIAQVFYQIGLNGTILGVVLVHASHGLVLAVWIASAAFASVDVSLEEASRNLGASAWTCFRTVTLPLATPGLIASAIFVFLESLDEFTGTYFVGVPDVTTLPLLMFNATHGRQLPDRLDYRAAPADPVDRFHARGRALPQGRCAGDGGALTPLHRTPICVAMARTGDGARIVDVHCCNAGRPALSLSRRGEPACRSQQGSLPLKRSPNCRQCYSARFVGTKDWAVPSAIPAPDFASLSTNIPYRSFASASRGRKGFREQASGKLPRRPPRVTPRQTKAPCT